MGSGAERRYFLDTDAAGVVPELQRVVLQASGALRSGTLSGTLSGTAVGPAWDPQWDRSWALLAPREALVREASESRDKCKARTFCTANLHPEAPPGVHRCRQLP